MARTERPMLAIAVRIAATLFLATLMMLVKYASQQGIALPELLFWRQAVTIPVLLGLLLATGQMARLKTGRARSHAFRATVSVIGMTAVFIAASRLTLPQASVLTFTSPFFAVLTALLVFGERVGRIRWLAVTLGFAGVLIVANPTVSDVDPLGAAAGLVAAFVVVAISYQVKDLARTDDPIACVFYLGLFSTACLAVLMPFFAQKHTTFEWLLLFGIGLSGITAQYLMTVSLQYGAISTVLIFDYALLLWSTVYSWLVFSNLPQLGTWLGAPLIIAAGIIIIWRERLALREPPPVSAMQVD